MPVCECIEKCPFFNDKMVNMPSTAEIYKIKYCKNDNFGCARHIVLKALGREKVPGDLFPNMTDKAFKLVSQAS